MPRTELPTHKASRFTILASVCVIVAALYFAQDVLMPLALAMLLSFLLTPVVKRLERFGLGRVPSVLIAVTALFAAIGVLGYVVGMQVIDLGENIDRYKTNIVAKVRWLKPDRGGVLEKLGTAAAEVQEGIEKPAATTTTQPTQPAQATGRQRPAQPAQAAPPATQSSPDNPTYVTVVQPRASPMQTLARYLGFTLGPLGTAGIVLVFVFFMLLQREDLRNRLIRLAASGDSSLTIATQALDDAANRISRYLLAQAIVNGTYGVAVSVGLWVIGATLGRNDASGTENFPNVVLWGLLCALLRFIPYVGPWIAAAFPLLLSLAVYQGFAVFAAAAAMFIVIEIISNNLMEPLLYGSSTGMSTVAVLVSAVFWTWLWGAVGLLLATPLTVVLVVLGKYVPALGFLDVLLGSEPVLSPPSRLYQRLLALDGEESIELAREFRDAPDGSLEKVYEDVLLPALAMAEQDRHRGALDERRERFVRQTMREIVDELGDEERARLARASAAEVEQSARGEPPEAGMPAVTSDRAGNGHPQRVALPNDCTVNVVLLPAHDEADEIVNLMLAQLLELQGYCAFAISQDALASEMLDQIESRRADVVVVSALPPSAVAHARYLCKRVHARYPDVAMLVGVWSTKADPAKVKARITCVASVSLAMSLAEAQAQIQQLAQPALVRQTKTVSRGA
jgi:predicted PurR-regulated permease PerM